MKKISKPSDLLFDEHFTVAGKTRSGKSVCGATLLKLCERGVYVNVPDKKRDKYDFVGKDADLDTPKGAIKQAMIQDMKVKYHSHYKAKERDKELRGIYEECKAASKELPEDAIIRIFVDEAHDFGDQLEYILRDGSGHGIFVTPISQEPDDLQDGALSQIEMNISYKLGDQAEGWAKHYGMPFEAIQKWCDHKKNGGTKYRFTVYDGEDLQKCQPLPFPP